MSLPTRLFVSITTAVALAFLPLVALYIVFANVAHGGLVTDFEQAFYPAAEALLDGEDPYPSLDDPDIAAGRAYVYPPLTAIATIPLTALSVDAAGFVVMALLVAMVVGTLVALGVRDWRCYGLAFLWPPVLSSIQTGNITIPLALGAALAWRFRDRSLAAGVSVGLSLAAKLILWPLLLWLAVLGRLRAVVISLAVGVATVAVSWAAIGFDAVGRYPDLLRRLQELEEPEGYTVYALAFDLGASSTVSRALGVAVAGALLAGVVVLGRRGDDRRAFVLAVAAALACSPIVWLHYFALLLVAVAVAQPRLGPAWFAPLLMYFSTGTYNGSTFQTAITIGAAVLTVAAAMRLGRSEPATARPALVRRGPLTERST